MQWLFGAELTGIALVALAVACRPGPPLVAMVGHGAASALKLAYASLIGYARGVLLWPAVMLHLVLTTLLAGTCCSGKTSTEGESSW